MSTRENKSKSCSKLRTLIDTLTKDLQKEGLNPDVHFVELPDQKNTSRGDESQCNEMKEEGTEAHEAEVEHQNEDAATDNEARFVEGEAAEEEVKGGEHQQADGHAGTCDDGEEKGDENAGKSLDKMAVLPKRNLPTIPNRVQTILFYTRDGRCTSYVTMNNMEVAERFVEFFRRRGMKGGNITKEQAQKDGLPTPPAKRDQLPLPSSGNDDHKDAGRDKRDSRSAPRPCQARASCPFHPEFSVAEFKGGCERHRRDAGSIRRELAMIKQKEEEHRRREKACRMVFHKLRVQLRLDRQQLQHKKEQLLLEQENLEREEEEVRNRKKRLEKRDLPPS